MTTPAARALFADLFDYAGLFPPSKLPMDRAVADYAEYVTSAHAWMLSRFVVPVTRLGEFEEHAAERSPKPEDGRRANGLAVSEEDEELADKESKVNPHRSRPKPWKLSAIINADKSLDKQIEAIFDFNAAHESAPSRGLVEIDSIELKGATPAAIDAAMDVIPEQLNPFFELDHSGDIRGHVAALAGTGGAAKIRCGGVTADAFPSAEEVAVFIAACAAAEVPFKFTAGLHHPIRAEQNLTYEANPPRGVMHGFINVFTAAALAFNKRLKPDELVKCVESTEPTEFRFEGDALNWGGHSLNAEQLERTRFTFAVSVGSCSFTEPVDDLKGLGLLE